LDLHVSNFFFLDSPCLSCNNRWRERPTQSVDLLFCGMDGWYNANSRLGIARGIWCACESWSWKHEKNSSNTTIWQSSMQRQAAYVYRVFDISHHMAFVGLWHIKGEL
jgi:hypothetical protein